MDSSYHYARANQLIQQIESEGYELDDLEREELVFDLTPRQQKRRNEIWDHRGDMIAIAQIHATLASVGTQTVALPPAQISWGYR